MKKIITSTLAVSTLMMSMGCKSDFDRDVSNIAVTSGKADFSKYVAIGNSLTSGMRDGVLYSDGQNESFPSMLAKQMQLAGGGVFTQPAMPNNVGGFTNVPGMGGKYTLQMVDVKDYTGVAIGKKLSPVQSPAAAALDIIGGAGKYFNNMGVPGAKSFHLVAPGYGNASYVSAGAANPYFVRFATSGSTSVLADAVAQKPTFFSLWVGSNDVLSYATSGGTNVSYATGSAVYTPATDQTGNTNPATYKSSDITDPTVVAGVIKTILDKLAGAGAKQGVIANIPYVTSIPYFTTVPYNPVPLSAESAAVLNTNFGQINAKLASVGMPKRFATLAAGAGNPVLIIDTTLPNIAAYLPAQYAMYGQARHATAEDLVLLPAASVIGIDPKTGLPPAPISQTINGVTIPLPDQLVLTKAESAKVLTAIQAYNTSIASLASSYGLALVDANSVMATLNSTSGIKYDGVSYSAKFITGGSFSLDGVHPTGRGYGVLANEFIKAINSKYGSTLPQVNPNNYTGVAFP